MKIITWRGQDGSVDGNVTQMFAFDARVAYAGFRQNVTTFRSDASGIRSSALARSDEIGVNGEFRELFVLESLHELWIKAAEARSQGEQRVQEVEDSFFDGLAKDRSKAAVRNSVAVDD